MVDTVMAFIISQHEDLTPSTPLDDSSDPYRPRVELVKRFLLVSGSARARSTTPTAQQRN